MTALFHPKTNPVADFTGTVTVHNSTGGTQTAAATDLVRPSDWNSAHAFLQTISGNTAGQSTAGGTNLVIGGTNGVQVSLSTAASAATLWVGVEVKAGHNPYADYPLVAGQVGQGTLQFDPEVLPPVAFDRLAFPIVNTNSSNSSGSHTLSFWAGIYTRNGSTLSLLASVSASTALTHSGTAGSYSLYSGMRLFTMGMTQTLSGGDYWLGFVSRTTSGGANGTYSNMLGSNINSNFVGFFGQSHNTTQQFTLGQGVYSATTSGMPASVAFSQIRGSDSMGLREVPIMFASGTV